jgi:hypothetical protein
MGAGGDLQLARRRSQSLEIECLRRPLNDDSLGRIAQPVATWCDLLAPPVRISDLYAVFGNICPHHLPAAVQGIEIPLHLRIRVPCPPFAGSVAATRPGVSATAWAGVCAIRSRVCTCAVPGSRASARASSRTAAAARASSRTAAARAGSSTSRSAVAALLACLRCAHQSKGSSSVAIINHCQGCET